MVFLKERVLLNKSDHSNASVLCIFRETVCSEVIKSVWSKRNLKCLEKPIFQHFFEHALVKGKSSLKTPIERFTLTDSSLKSDSEHVSAPSETR